jgi:ABC-2 type transport system permease protein
MQLAAAPAAWSRIAASLGIMLLTAVAISWVAGKIYRAGILATGKKASLAEIIRWIRAA